MPLVSLKTAGPSSRACATPSHLEAFPSEAQLSETEAKRTNKSNLGHMAFLPLHISNINPLIICILLFGFIVKSSLFYFSPKNKLPGSEKGTAPT